MSFSWQCPYCNHNATINSDNYSVQNHIFNNGNLKGKQNLESKIIVCPNPDCKEYTIEINLEKLEFIGGVGNQYSNISTYKLKPNSLAKPFPNYIPKGLIKDYEEACLIKDLSPKASATLSRRCIQGLIRDFWKVERPNLYQEIEAIKDKVNPSLWRSIHAIREIGNIGAHMQKDIDIIIEVEPREAVLLIKLIEILFEKTYIKDYEENDLFEEISLLAVEKKN